MSSACDISVSLEPVETQLKLTIKGDAAVTATVGSPSLGLSVPQPAIVATTDGGAVLKLSVPDAGALVSLSPEATVLATTAAPQGPAGPPGLDGVGVNPPIDFTPEVDGAQTAFLAPEAFDPVGARLYLNGVRLRVGVSNDYVCVESSPGLGFDTFVLSIAPIPGDVVLAEV